EYALAVLEKKCQIIFHAREKVDLAEAVRLRQENPDAHGVLASFGVLIPSSVLEAFEVVEYATADGAIEKRNEGILNIHPSLLPLYRGASPIESAILNGEKDFGVSVMKLVKAMDAGPIYKYATLENASYTNGLKELLYKTTAEAGAAMVLSVLQSKSPVEPVPQDDSKATFCAKFEKKDGILAPETENAEMVFRKILAFQGFPKAKYAFYGKNCAILEAHICEQGETAVLPLPCADGQILSIDRLQPDGKKPMDAKSFLNGYAK
ncbi:MAG: formyltransferase family protein, partial [Candidatus Saccharibacteria bacterium]|nr:formyltransferase family protein [Candidatus Saccharibacteria bacterium]